MEREDGIEPPTFAVAPKDYHDALPDELLAQVGPRRLERLTSRVRNPGALPGPEGLSELRPRALLQEGERR